MWATAPRQPSIGNAVPAMVSEPVKSAVGAMTTWAPGNSSRSQAVRGNVQSGAPVSVQDTSQASDPAPPLNCLSPALTPSASNHHGPVAGSVGTGPNRSVRGGPSGANQVAQPCA